MSTGDGAILAMSTVWSHNLLRSWFKHVPFFKEDKNLLTLARLSTMLWAPLGGMVASVSPGLSGYLLIVAFDIMLAGSVVPMFAAVYWKNCKPPVLVPTWYWWSPIAIHFSEPFLYQTLFLRPAIGNVVV